MATAGMTPMHEYSEYTSAQRWVILVALMMGTVMMIIDASIVNVAIPTMMGTLGATLTQISWVSTGYIIAQVIMLPLTGWLSTHFGRKRYLTFSIVLFTAASFLCGTAHSLQALIIYRVLQGIGGAALLSTAQATMMEIFPPWQLGMVQAIYGIGVMVGPTIGPTLGGWITDNYQWPWIFFINVPIGIAATVLTILFVHNSKYQQRSGAGIDIVGIGLLAVGLGCLQTMLEEGNRADWFSSPFIVWMTLLAGFGLLAFVLWELHTPYPAVNLRILRNRGFASGTLYGAVLGVGLYGGIFILPVFLQQLRHFTALQTGKIMLPGAIATAICMPFVGKLVSRFPARNLVAIGGLGFIASTLMLRHLTLNTGQNEIYWPLILRGAAMGFLFVPLSLATLVGLKGREIAEGTGLFNLARQLGGSAGIAILTTFIEHRNTLHRALMLERINLYNPLAMQRLALFKQFFISKGASALTAQKQALVVMNLTISGQAAVLSYNDAFAFIAILFLLAMPLLLLFKKSLPGMTRPPAGSGE